MTSRLVAALLTCAASLSPGAKVTAGEAARASVPMICPRKTGRR